MNKIAITTLVMAAGISSALAIWPPIRTGPYASNLTPTSDHSLGLKQVLFIRTQFPDLPTSKTQADCQTVMEQVRQRYVRFSYGRTDMNVTVTAVAYMMPHESTYYVTQSNQDACWTALMNDAVAAASADYPVDRRSRPGTRSRALGAALAPSSFGLAPEAVCKA
jgi:hypothetical protein